MLDSVQNRRPPVEPHPAPHSEYIRPADLARFTKRNISIIGACTLAGLALGALYVNTAEPIYLAKTQLLIATRTPQLLRDQVGEVVFSLDNAQVESQLAVLRSENNSSAVIDRLHLTDDPEFVSPKPGLLGRITGMFGSPPPALGDFERRRIAISSFEQGLDVRRVGLSYVIEISFASREADKASRIANATAAAYIDGQVESRLEAARQGSDWLESRISDIRGQLNAAVERVQQLKSSHDYRVVREPEAGPDGRARPTLEELEATAATYRKIYETFLQSYSEAVQRESAPAPDARVITPATRPLSNTYPRTRPILGLSAVLGAMLGFGIALIQHTRRRHPTWAAERRPELAREGV
ncbi:GumC family protein [Alsobacter soli]|nr:hypothetical protein [Alsobacter soli]